MNITVVGGGNVGTQIAAHCAEKKHEVTMYTSNPEKFSTHLTIVDEQDSVIHCGIIKEATFDEHKAFKNAEVILITLPAFCMRDIATKIEPYAKKGLKIGIIPGTGGGECAFKGCLEKGASIFGLQRVPSVARLLEYGKLVRATGYRDVLHVASLPRAETNGISEFISSIFDIKCEILPNYLTLTLTPSNPILHTTRLKTIFKDYEQGKIYDTLPLFYEEWNEESSRLLFDCDSEVQKICDEIKQFDLSKVKSLKVHYESDTPEALTKKIRSIKGFKGLTTPAVFTGKGYIPDLNSRYFTADFSYGLTIISQIADFYNVQIPTIWSVLSWYKKISLIDSEYSYLEYGIINKEDFVNFYSI